MATLSASAKLYTGIRCWCVDKNISAALTASFGLGNQNQPSPVLVGGVPTVYANVKVNKLIRAVADVSMTPSVSLTNERYKTYGGGNNVMVPGVGMSGFSPVSNPYTLSPSDRVFEELVGIASPSNANYSNPLYRAPSWKITYTTTGVTNFQLKSRGQYISVGDRFTIDSTINALIPISTTITVTSVIAVPIVESGGWTAVSTVSCKFPTYFRIDVEKLQLPEGTDCTVSFEEGWILEGNFPGSTRAPSLAVPNFFTFRTPWYGLSFMNSAFTQSTSYKNFRPFSSSITGAFTPLVSAQISAKGVSDLQSAFSVGAIIGKKKFFASQMYGVFGPMGPGSTPYLEGNGYPYDTGLGSWNVGFPGIVKIKQLASVFESAVSSVSCIGADARLMASSMSSAFTFGSQADKLKGVSNEIFGAEFSSSIQPVKTVSAQSNITSSFSMSSTPRLKGSLKQTVRKWSAIAAAPNGDVWATVRSTNPGTSGDGGIYVKYNNSDTFTLHTNLDKLWTGVAVSSAGDVWASHEGFYPTYGGGVYYKLSSSSSFVQDNQAPQAMYQHIAVNDYDGSLYAAVGDPNLTEPAIDRTILRRLGPNRRSIRPEDSANIGPGQWEWRTLAPFGDWAGVATKAGDPDVWFSTHGGDVYKLNVTTYSINTGQPDEIIYYNGFSNADLVGINIDTKSFQDIAFAPNGDLYAATTTVEAVEPGDGYLWKLTGGTGSTFTQITSDTLRKWTGITVSSDGIIYACEFDGNIYIIDYV